MALRLHHHLHRSSPPFLSSSSSALSGRVALLPRPFTDRRHRVVLPSKLPHRTARRRRQRQRHHLAAISASALDLTEENIRQVLADARTELAQIFDASVGITGEVDLAELDGPFVKLRLKGRFWHKRSTVLARLDNYLRNRIPEILEVDIEDEKQLDDSPENF